MSREDDIRADIRDRLLATDEFQAVYPGSFESHERPASDWRGAAIEPVSTHQIGGFDAALDGGFVYDMRVQITVAARVSGSHTRDRIAEHLLQVVKAALNGQNLADFTDGQVTRITGWTWLPATDNERRITAILTTQYIEEGWGAGDTDDP